MAVEDFIFDVKQAKEYKKMSFCHGNVALPELKTSSDYDRYTGC